MTRLRVLALDLELPRTISHFQEGYKLSVCTHCDLSLSFEPEKYALLICST